MPSKKFWGHLTIKGLEEMAFYLELTVPLPKFREKYTRKAYVEANRIRKILGEPTKKYFTIKKRKLVRVV